MTIVTPANTVLASGTPMIDTSERLEGTVTYAAPGRLVKEGSSGEGYVTVCGAAEKALGVIGFKEAHPGETEDHTISTAFSLTDHPPVLKGSFMFRGVLQASQGALVSGQLLAPGTNGSLAKQTAVTVTPVARLEKPVSNNGSEQIVLATWLG